MTNYERLELCYPSILSSITDYVIECHFSDGDYHSLDDVISYINCSSVSELLNYYLDWEGIQGYTEKLYSMFENFADLLVVKEI